MMLKKELTELERAVKEYCGEEKKRNVINDCFIALVPDEVFKGGYNVRLSYEGDNSGPWNTIECSKGGTAVIIECQNISPYYRANMLLGIGLKENGIPTYSLNIKDLGVLGLRKFLGIDSDAGKAAMISAIYKNFGFSPATRQKYDTILQALKSPRGVLPGRIDPARSIGVDKGYWVEVNISADMVDDGVIEEIEITISEERDTTPERLPLLESSHSLWNAITSGELNKRIANEDVSAYRALAKRIYTPGKRAPY